MENASDAIKIAFAVMVFSIALALTFSIVSQLKATSDTVLYYTDETNFYDYEESRTDNRKVSSSEVIAVLHRYYIESIDVVVKIGNDEYVFVGGNETIVNRDGSINTTSTEKLNTYKQKEENLNNFIKNKIFEDEQFKEEFVEAPISGIYKHGEADTEIVITPGEKRIYVTYTKVP